MSYCRWSSDDFRSDLYVYANVSGAWTIHVAGNRIVGACPAVRRPTDIEDEAQVATWVADNRARRAFLDVAERVEIGLPYDGKTFDTGSPGDCAEWCAELAALGYHLPAGVIETLREEQAEMDAEESPHPAKLSAGVSLLGDKASPATDDHNPTLRERGE